MPPDAKSKNNAYQNQSDRNSYDSIENQDSPGEAKAIGISNSFRNNNSMNSMRRRWIIFGIAIPAIVLVALTVVFLAGREVGEIRVASNEQINGTNDSPMTDQTNSVPVNDHMDVATSTDAAAGSTDQMDVTSTDETNAAATLTDETNAAAGSTDQMDVTSTDQPNTAASTRDSDPGAATYQEDFLALRDQCPEADPLTLLKPLSIAEKVENGAVAADDARCSKIGLAILRDHGGNAIDAAVATALCLSVVNPSASGLGGGGFMLLHSDANPERQSRDFNEKRKRPHEAVPEEKVTEFIDFREVAPADSSWDMFEDDTDASWNGGKAIAVPGYLKGLDLAHSRHGRLPWRTVVEPAMELARAGVEVDGYLAHAINLKSSKAKIFRNEHLTKLLTKDHDGETLLQEGDILTNPTLANTYETIMKEGADAIYTGELARKIAEDIQDRDGIITYEDLASFRATLRDPLITEPGEINGFTMVGAPPPSSGGSVVIGAARFLSGYKEPFSGVFDDTLSVHRLVEAMKHAYAIRMSLSDPDFYENITAAAVEDLVRGPFMESLREKTRDDNVLPMSAYGGDKWGLISDEDLETGTLFVGEEGHDNRRKLRAEEANHGHRDLRGFQYLNDHGTTHISIVDRDRNAVTMTCTINTYFGSGVLSPSTGIIFNSQMDDFSSPGAPNHYGVEPSPSNYIVPGKKPLSSISPTFVFRPDKKPTDERHLGKLVLAFGASGGPKIPTATLQVFMNYILKGMPLYESIVEPRVHDQLLFKGYSTTLFDNSHLLQGPKISLSERTKEALVQRGHNIAPVPNTGTSQAVAVDLETGKLTAVSDPRKGGKAYGY